MCDYFSFVVSGWFWKLTTKVKADYVFTFEVSPMTQALIGVWYAKKKHIPHYIYVQDLWPENVETVTGIHTPFVIKPIDMMVDYIYKNSDIVFTTSPSFKKAIKQRKNFSHHTRVIYWPQYAEEFYKPVAKKSIAEIPDDGSFKIIFTGNVGYAQGLDILPKAAVELKKENVRFVIVGDGRYMEEFQSEILRLDVQDSFILVPRQAPERIPELLRACDVAFLSFMDTRLFEITIPAKLRSYMACGMPVLAAANGETERIICEAECGYCSPLGDAKELARYIMRMAKEPMEQLGRNSRRYFEAHFQKIKLMDQIDRIFS